MKVFKFNCSVFYYAFAAETLEKAIEAFEDETGDNYESYEEIPESEWDKKQISIWEDNDLSKVPDVLTIREVMCGSEPQLIYSNDF